MADRVGAGGYDAYSLLAAIGRDCVGALQFIAGDDDAPEDSTIINGEPVDEATIEQLLTHLAQAPLGLTRDDTFRISVAHAGIARFGQTKALVVERFDRAWTQGRLIRLPQEDCCQALGVLPARKYQSDGGPGLVQIAQLLKGSDRPAEDLRTLFQAQAAFWRTPTVRAAL